MIVFLSLLLHVVVSPFRTKARLEAEIIILRHQLNVLRRNVPLKPKLVPPDRLLFVWLIACFHRRSMPSPLCSPRQSSGGIGLAFAFTGIGSRAQFHWRSNA